MGNFSKIMHARHEEITSFTDAVCRRNLNDEYARLEAWFDHFEKIQDFSDGLYGSVCEPLGHISSYENQGRIHLMDLFDHTLQERMKREAPLAARMRPRTLDEFVGQENALQATSAGPGKGMLHMLHPGGAQVFFLRHHRQPYQV
jgi:hypothetical protein